MVTTLRMDRIGVSLKRLMLLFDVVTAVDCDLALHGDDLVAEEKQELQWLKDADLFDAPNSTRFLGRLRGGKLTAEERDLAHRSIADFAYLWKAREQNPKRSFEEAIRDPEIHRRVVTGNYWDARIYASWIRRSGPHDAVVVAPEVPLSSELRVYDSDVVSVVLNQFPEPDEATPWQTILDFKQDTDARAAQLRLRRWMHGVSSDVRPAAHVHDELRSLLADYENHMRIHKMKYGWTTFESIATAAADILENVVRLKFGAATRSLFAIGKRRADLLQAEAAAPGREVAYLARVHREFASR